MGISLDQWQAHLEKHFRNLAKNRVGSEFPVFALEHGLSKNDLAEISSLLLSRLEARLPLQPHWLLWLIYATEFGYSYDGDEYWFSFEKQTPYWEFSDRYKVVPWFTEFQKTFDGATPTGPWATHFRIIAWPITHAILPRYLQRQFARTLYDLRYKLVGLAQFDAVSIGRILAAYAHGCTRFETFLQQEELAGRIVLALLGQEIEGVQQPIFLPALERIVTDLEKVRAARGWLRATRRVVVNHFRGIGRGSCSSVPGIPSEQHGRDSATGQPQNLSIRPNLMLRHSGGGTWSLVIDIPDFRNFAESADILAFLNKTRCRLNGAEGIMPAGWVLSGRRKAVLKSWPDSQKPLLLFEAHHGVLDHLIESDCRLDPGQNWLFRIGQDGIAREIVGRTVRPYYEYIIVTNGELPADYPYIGACTIECEGVKAFHLTMPDVVSAEDIVWLKKLDLQVARTIRVWPAGLSAHMWDGEGNCEWLTTEEPSFGIIHDYPIDAYCLHLNEGSTTIIAAGPVGTPKFFKLPSLPEGVHKLDIWATASSSAPMPPPLSETEGHLILNVRKPELWMPGRPAHSGLIVTVDPHDATLDVFWENQISLSVLGPENHRVTCKVTLRRRNGELIFSEQAGESLSLPVTPESWRRNFERFLEHHKDIAWHYLEAAEGSLSIISDEIGEYVVNFEHDITPVRWVVRNHSGTLSIRLIDDSGNEQSQPTALFLSFEHPVSAKTLSADSVLSGREVSVPGGLFLAQYGQYQDSVAVSAGLTGPGLAGLGVIQDVSPVSTGAVTLGQAIRLFTFWRSARLAGPLADVRRENSACEILSAVYKTICGFNWAKAEKTYCNNPRARHAADGLQHNIERKSGFGAVLRRDFERINDGFAEAAQWYVELADRYHICKERRLCEFALWLACQPQRLPEFYGRDLDALFHSLRNHPALLRGARLLSLLSANQKQDGPALRLPRWTW